MFTLMSAIATGSRLIGYGAIFLVLQQKEPALSLWYGLVLVAEILQISAIIGLGISNSRSHAKAQENEDLGS